ncbi:ABC transporter ATP-binding protein [Prescottella sp. R16]|uniref:ABC transporter ATP-binding protein n=1 Tax=Prescottella sp. R16 TaxID=3064529 RepID=UPI00272E586C|nr:ABC transporter ATP-binding protein [Prescottella sp. R16]
MTEPIVALSSVTKSFGPRRVLDGIDLTVRPGEFVSVIGPSGCGKSTLFAVVAGLETADTGTATAPTCAHMPQKDLLLPWRSILDNTTLGLEVQRIPRKQARARAAALFPRFGLAGFEDARPHELSGGMRQRAALLRTVVQDRPVLLLDEPFGALDSLTRTEMQTWLQDVWLQDRWTVLMITHDVREAVFLSDRVIVLSDRPATVRRDVVVDLPRPRDLSIVTSPEFAAIEGELIALLRRTTPVHS